MLASNFSMFLHIHFSNRKRMEKPLTVFILMAGTFYMKTGLKILKFLHPQQDL